MTQLAGKVVWVTGASSGIGEAMAKAANAAGARVVLTSRREAELARVKAACANPANAAVYPLDLLKLSNPAQAVAAAEQFFGPVDVLVNNAGVSQRSMVMDTTMDVYRQIFELDFFATIALSKAVLPGMIARKGGHIVVVSSVVGYISSPMRSGYAAAKHALHGWYDALRAEHWRDGVKVTLACPGYIRTNVTLNAVDGKGGQWGKLDPSIAKGMAPEECARQIWSGVARDKHEVFVGKEKVAVWIKRHFPALFDYAVARAKPIQ